MFDLDPAILAHENMERQWHFEEHYLKTKQKISSTLNA